MTAKRMPRRAKSMANRASKIAEGAADLDLLGGDEAAEAKAEAPPVSTGAQVGAFTLIIVGLIAVVMIVRLIMAIPTGGTGGDAPFGIDGALTRSTPEAEAPASAGATGRSTLASVPRSPFPIADQDEPIIMAVTCPDGTVQIATGDMVADTVCIRGVLVTGDDDALMSETSSIVAPNVILVTAEGDRANVGGTDVPNGLTCAEDEVIGFDGQPDTLVCVHIDSFLP